MAKKKKFRGGDCVVTKSGRKIGKVLDVRRGELTVAWYGAGSDRYVDPNDVRHCGSSVSPRRRVRAWVRPQRALGCGCGL